MIKKYYLLILSILAIVLYSCEDDNGTDLPPVEQRVNEAITGLRNDLTAPSEGWRLEYQPTPDAGIFFMLLDFDEDGQVIIKSDVVDNDGRFFEQTIPYRIDNSLGLELIFETFAVFHYLFEQDQASFGAEFEFIFKENDGGNLVFESKSDFSDPTIIVFQPASAGDETSFSRDIAENLDAYKGLSPRIFGETPPIQQIILDDRNVSVFWTLDLAKRNIQADLAGTGSTMDEVLGNGGISLNHTTGYALRNGKLVLVEPLSFVLNGGQITISEISLNNFDMTGPSLCPVKAENSPKYKGQAQGLGNVTMISSLLSTNGDGFQPNNVYDVNVTFIFDGEGNSLADDGIIQEKFPNASGFIFLYGINPVDPNIPPYSLGLILDNGNLILREFEPTNTQVNLVRIKFTDNFFFSGDPNPEDQQNLIKVTDQIFEGGEVYAFDFPANGITVFKLFNPCNGHEVFLVQ